MKILLIGSTGMLGRAVKNVLIKNNISFDAFTSKELDITKDSSFDNLGHYTHIINCAGYTNVEMAERDIVSASLVNSVGCLNLANYAKDNSIFLVHFSTDYIFDGKNKNPYKEDDKPNPLNAYGLSKLDGENYIKDVLSNYLIIRTSWLFAPWGNNFLRTMIKAFNEKDEIKVVNDQFGNPTSAINLADCTINLIKLSKKGVYHCTNNGSVSWFEFAQKILEILKEKQMINKDVKLIPISTDEYWDEKNCIISERPKNSILSIGLINNVFNSYPKNWVDSLYECITYINDNGDDYENR